MTPVLPTATHQKILRIIGSDGSMSRAALIGRTGLSKAAISGLVRDLIDLGLAVETRSANGSGRPLARVAPRADGAFFVGLSMASDPARVAVVDFAGDIVATRELARAENPEDFADALAQALEPLLASSAVPLDRVCGIGVALSGLVDEKQATCIRSTILGWQGVPLAAMIRERTGFPTLVENDAKALALAERLFGEARGLHSFTLVWLGPGIGAAHFVHDQLFRGAHGGAGEIAHTTVELDGRPCRCGKVGCLDTVASVTAIMDSAREAGLDARSLADLDRLAAGGSSAAIRILHRAGSALGLAISHIIQINDPQMVLLTHGGSNLDGLLATVMLQTVEANVLPGLAGATPIRFAATTPCRWTVAAASVATHAFLNGTLAPRKVALEPVAADPEAAQASLASNRRHPI